MDHPVVDLTCCQGSSNRRSNGKSRSKIIQRQSRSTSRSTRQASSRSPQSNNALDSSSDSPSSRHPSERPQTANSSSTGPSTPMEHVPGDGFDFRRPATTSTRNQPLDVIDLTASDDEADEDEDIQIISATTNSTTTNPHTQAPQNSSLRQAQRGPRYARPIMNDDDDDTDEGFGRFVSRPRPQRSNSAFRRQRRLPDPIPQRAAQNSTPATAQDGGHGAPRPEIIEIDDDRDDDELGARVMRNFRSGTAAFANIQQTRELRRSHDQNRQMQLTRAQDVGRALGILRTFHARLPTSGVFAPMMDYTQPAFNIFASAAGSHGGPRAPSPVPAAQSYDELPAAAEGFTRSPREGDTLICPFCEEELCVGEGEVKSQIWAVRACGHVYCGACANSRPKARPRKAGSEDKLTTCVVPNCGEKLIGQRAMYQLFL